jgi:hypothetical protein
MWCVRRQRKGPEKSHRDEKNKSNCPPTPGEDVFVQSHYLVLREAGEILPLLPVTSQ